MSTSVGAHGRRRAAGVVVHRQAELLAHLPQRLVAGVEQLGQTEARRRAGQQHPAAQAGGMGASHLGHRRLDVVQGDLRDAGAAAGRVGAEVGEPAVVRLEAGPPPFHVARGERRGLAGERDLGEERRHGVREDDLGDLAVELEVAAAARRVPVALALVAEQVLVRDLVGGGPRVELVEPPGLEVGPVVVDAAAGMAVGRDHDVALIAAVIDHDGVPFHAHPPPCISVTATVVGFSGRVNDPARGPRRCWSAGGDGHTGRGSRWWSRPPTGTDERCGAADRRRANARWLAPWSTR